MAAIPVASTEMPVSTPPPLDIDQWADHERRLTILERAAFTAMEDRIAALEAEVFP